MPLNTKLEALHITRSTMIRAFDTTYWLRMGLSYLASIDFHLQKPLTTLLDVLIVKQRCILFKLPSWEAVRTDIFFSTLIQKCMAKVQRTNTVTTFTRFAKKISFQLFQVIQLVENQAITKLSRELSLSSCEVNRRKLKHYKTGSFFTVS